MKSQKIVSKTQKIRKAIIPVAGFGTRFLPATKSQPKEMLPIVDKPVVQYIVEAAAKSGIEEIIMVTNSNKRAVEDHFDYAPELESFLAKVGKKALLQEIKNIPKLANFIYVRQKGPYGNGTPVLNAESLIGDEPFAVFFGDEFFASKQPWMAQMMKVYEKYQDSVLSVMRVPKNEVSRWGIVSGKEVEPGVFQITDITEKPTPEQAKSNLAIAGGYILVPEIFSILKKTKIGKGNELWLSDALATLLKKRPIYAKIIEGTYHDAGTVEGWLETNVSLALQHPVFKNNFRKYLKGLKL